MICKYYVSLDKKELYIDNAIPVGNHAPIHDATPFGYKGYINADDHAVLPTIRAFFWDTYKIRIPLDFPVRDEREMSAWSVYRVAP